LGKQNVTLLGSNKEVTTQHIPSKIAWDQSVVWLVLFTGGIHSPIIIWLTPPPLIAGVLIG